MHSSTLVLCREKIIYVFAKLPVVKRVVRWINLALLSENAEVSTFRKMVVNSLRQIIVRVKMSLLQLSGAIPIPREACVV